jgi:hypothetical protein
MGKAIESNIESKKLVQNIIVKLKDGYQTVSKSAQETLISMTRTMPNVMHCLVNKLSANFQSAYNDLVVQEKIEQKGGLNDIQLADNVLGLGEDIKESNQYVAASEWPEINGLVFGLVPQYIIKQLGATANWKERSDAIENLKNLINDQDSITKLEKYISSFINFTIRLLNDPNYKVSFSTLQIISIPSFNLNLLSNSQSSGSNEKNHSYKSQFTNVASGSC